MAKSGEQVVTGNGSPGAMLSLIRTGYIFFKLETGEKAFPQKKYIGLYSEAQKSRPHILVCRDERMFMSKIFLYKIIDEDVQEVKEWSGEECWEHHSFKIETAEVQFVFSAISKRERDGWLEEILRHFQRFKVKKDPVSYPDGKLYENPYKFQTKFTVKADEGSQHLLGAMGTLTLMVCRTCLIIISTHGNKLADFDTTVVRKCGFTPDSFHMIVGRRSMIGSAFLKFRTTEGKHIYRQMMESKYAVKMGKHLLGENTVPSTYESPVFTRPGHEYESCEALDSQVFDLSPAEDPDASMDVGVYLEPDQLFTAVKTKSTMCETNPSEPFTENIPEAEASSPAAESAIETPHQKPELFNASVSYQKSKFRWDKISLSESFDKNIPETEASPAAESAIDSPLKKPESLNATVSYQKPKFSGPKISPPESFAEKISEAEASSTAESAIDTNHQKPKLPNATSPAAESVTATSHHGFKEHEWHIKTMMMIEFAKEFSKGNKKRFCDFLNGFLERHGMSPLEFEWESAKEGNSNIYSNSGI